MLWLVLDRPEAGNSVTRAVQQALIENLRSASDDAGVRAVVLTGRGDKHFCTGPNLRDPGMQPKKDRIAGDAARILRTGSQAVVTALLDCEKPVLCALNGTAAGVGASMVLACDLIVAAESARIIELFARRGLAPDGGAAYLLARKVPFNVAKQLLFFGEELSAAEAERIGLVNKVVPVDALEETVAKLTATLASNAPLSLKTHTATVKAVCADRADRDMAKIKAAMAACFDSNDYKEGRWAFMEKRKPVFTGS